VNILSESLIPASDLLASVCPGLQAVTQEHKSRIDDDCRDQFSESLDLDQALLAAHPSEHRWDYLGHSKGRQLIAVETHTAADGEVSVLVKKRDRARIQLRSHLKPSAQIAKWLWIASGRHQILDRERAGRLLAQHGITYVGQRLSAKHLGSAASGRRRK
jgi:hypothetical protein